MSNPTTIQQVVDALDAIISNSIATGSRLGYFAALYNHVTCAVRDAIVRGDFQNGPRVERLDVTFANRYLTAYEQQRTDQRPTLAWLQAFEAASNDSHIILQHLLIGMNAHINLDLGIAAAETCPGDEIDSLHDDFDKINQILFRLIRPTEQDISTLSPEFRDLVNTLPFQGRVLAGVSLVGTRDFAWHFATTLARQTPFQRRLEIIKRDAEVALLGFPILTNWPIVQQVRSEESQDVANNIEVLASGEFNYTIKRHADAPPASPM